jgi:hypothetical protein
VNAARTNPPTPRTPARVRGAVAGARAAARKKERRIRRQERREQRDEEYRLREQQGLSPSATSEYSSSGEGEEEESDGGQAPPERWQPAPPSPRAAESAEEQVPRAGAELPTTRLSTEGAVRATEAPARAADLLFFSMLHIAELALSHLCLW